MPRSAVAGAPNPVALPVSFQPVLERLVLNIRADFGCVAIIAVFLIIMISTIVFADVITPPAANPFV